MSLSELFAQSLLAVVPVPFLIFFFGGGGGS